MVYTVALTGGIGSGKSTVANHFSRLGIAVIDADIIARQVVEPGQPALSEISAHFGNEILLPDGSLNRRMLREKIFDQADEKRWLNALLHPLIHQRTQTEISSARSPYALWVVPLLVENHLQHKADRVLVVDVSPEIQIARTTGRDNVSRQHAEQILAAQVTREQRLAVADDVINNDGSPNEVAVHVDRLHRQYLKLASQAAQLDKK
ncbi:dephospho-CoA kinase [Enterobacteriaceae bacterium H11S18]|uniref:dephospho-CoA kinase n=1 Tax=Dryocola clanedunensis TaxID=2925396 RepID=UPI0022EFEC25|nr:dephospho-CoA kinase [Dryocola clanedunensis]MCT4705204.1 dephospho-CoA kinase [Dryocola clanedunensis]MCT4711016.1 dephospho-CoA kinase [Dryocola clanedunensis]